MAADYDKVREVFIAACDLEYAEQLRMLDDRCDGDVELRSAVERLLHHDREEDDDSLGTLHVFAAEAATVEAPPPPPPERIGRYAIKGTLGEGGMGVVYLAEQEHPHRTVALKMIRTPYVSQGMLKRFEFESEVLALLEHPGIAKVYEVGTFSDGSRRQPFIAMEHVDGPRLLKHAEALSLGVRDRLELFMLICDAVQHAHRHGVIHRDLKPSNILIDTNGQPKILDFGVARSVTAQTGDAAHRTGTGQLVGTIPYMSPEQVAGRPGDLDTRSDVYALGVILFEYLTNQLPYDVSDRNIPEAARRITEHDPARLSSIDRVFRGDLDAIIRKALEKSPDDRYQSASELADDIRRHLEGEPIAAKKHSTLYMMRKTVRRYRWPIAVAATIMGLIISFGVYAGIQAGANRRLAEREVAASETARQESARADAVNEFLKDMLIAARPSGASTPDVSVRRVLDDAGARLEAGLLAGMPEVEAEVRGTMARTYFNLGLYRSAVPYYQWLLAYHENTDGPDTRTTLNLLLRLGVSSLEGAVNEAAWIARSEAAYTECLRRAERSLGDDDELTLAAMNGLARVWEVAGRHEESRALREEVYHSVQDSLGPDHSLLIDAAFSLGTGYTSEGRVEEAEPLYRNALERARAINGNDALVTIRIEEQLARGILVPSGRAEEAELLLRDALDRSRRHLGSDHPQTNRVTTALSIALVKQGRTDEAESMLREAIGLVREVRGAERDDTLSVVRELARVIHLQGRTDEAIDTWQRGIEAAIDNHGDGHGMIAGDLLDLSIWHAQNEQVEEAVAAARRATAIFEQLQGPHYTQLADGLHDLGWRLHVRGSHAAALEPLRRAYDIRVSTIGEANPNTVSTAVSLAIVHAMLDEYQEATAIVGEQRRLVEDVYGVASESWVTLVTHQVSILGVCERHDDSIATASDALASWRAAGGSRRGDAHLLRVLRTAYYHAGRMEEATEAMREAMVIDREFGSESSIDGVLAGLNLAQSQLASGHHGDAERNAREFLGRIDAFGEPRRFWKHTGELVLAETRLRQGDVEQAESMIRTWLEEVELPRHTAVRSARSLEASARNLFGQCLAAQGQYEEAEPLLLESYATFCEHYPKSFYTAREMARHIVALYDAWGRPDDAARWRERAG